MWLQSECVPFYSQSLFSFNITKIFVFYDYLLQFITACTTKVLTDYMKTNHQLVSPVGRVLNYHAEAQGVQTLSGPALGVFK